MPVRNLPQLSSQTIVLAQYLVHNFCTGPKVQYSGGQQRICSCNSYRKKYKVITDVALKKQVITETR